MIQEPVRDAGSEQALRLAADEDADMSSGERQLGVVRRTDFGAERPAASVVIRGADVVARQALLGGALPAARLHPALMNGTPGVIVTMHGRPFAVMIFTVAGGRVAEIDTIADPERVGRIAAAVLTDETTAR